MGDCETTDAETPAQDPVVYFLGAAAFFVLGNVDRLRSPTVGGSEMWPRTDELFAALEELGDGETTDGETRPSFRHPQDPVVWFGYQAAFFILENLDRLRNVVGGAEVWPRTDELFAGLEAYKRAKRRSLADLAKAVEAELTGDDPH
jgi:hypothetical protein